MTVRNAGTLRRSSLGAAGALSALLVGGGILLAAPAGAAPTLSPGCVLTSATVVTCTYAVPGVTSTVTIPTGTISAQVTAIGGAGGDDQIGGGAGGQGDLVTGALDLSGLSTLYAVVGGDGTSLTWTNALSFGPIPGGANGGGDGHSDFGSGGAGGGGASDVRTAPTDLSTRIVVAGAGGGASQQAGAGAGLDAAPYGGDPGRNGTAGTATGPGNNGYSSAPGALGQGGSAGFNGAGGGAGLWGGGGSNQTGAGGGGGSSLVPTGGSASLTTSLPSVTIVFTLATEPGAPTGVAATPGNGQATVSFTAPASDGGSPITGYTVTATDTTDTTAAPILVSGTASPITVTGLTNGHTYSFSVVAVNAVGSSLSATGPAVSPTAPAVPVSPTAPAVPVVAIAPVVAASPVTTPVLANTGAPITGLLIAGLAAVAGGAAALAGARRRNGRGPAHETLTTG
ncbi:MAG: hypothetical protein QOH56_4593 [Pseudonocardiales bacterium]|nr:hypothetical protein [Pseudonocardiales bacterium]